MTFLLVDLFRVVKSGEVLAGVFLFLLFCFLGFRDGSRVFCPAYPAHSVSVLVRVDEPLIRGTGHVSRAVGWVFGVVLDIYIPGYFSSRF